MEYEKVCALMKKWAVAAGKLVLEALSVESLNIADKARIGDITSRIDIISEDFLRTQIQGHFPGHRILGEEVGNSESGSCFTWVLDPVDGTLPMVLGFDYFGISLGLWEGNIPKISVIYFPKLKVLIWSITGQGTFIKRKGQITPVRLGTDKRAVQSFDYPIVAFDFSANRDRKKEIASYFDPLVRLGRYPFMFCCTTYHTLLLLEGKIHGLVHTGASIYDLGAVVLMVQEAGGDYVVSNTGKRDLGLEEKSIPIILACNAGALKKIRGIVGHY